jgi:tartrate-resistant acid phosphatase type 5
VTHGKSNDIGTSKSLKLIFKRVFSSRKRTWVALITLAVLVAAAQFFSSVPMAYLTHSWIVNNTKKPGSVRLLAVGDTGSGNENQKGVAAAMEKACQESPLDGVLLLGDNFYTQGVSGVEDVQWRTKFLDVYHYDCLKTTPFYALLGNHDYKGKPSSQIEYMEQSKGRWIMPARAYALQFGDVLGVAMLDTNFPDACGLPFCSLNWVAKALQEKASTWTITAGHHPLLSGGKYKVPRWPPRAFISDFVCASQSRIYLSGHDHNLQHLKGKSDYLPCEIDQLVLGGGGADLYEVEDLAGITQFKKMFYGFGEIKANETKLEFSIRDGLDASVVHSFERVK